MDWQDFHDTSEGFPLEQFLDKETLKRLRQLNGLPMEESPSADMPTEHPTMKTPSPATTPSSEQQSQTLEAADDKT